MQTLSAFCEVIRSSCHAVRSIVMSAAVCEEEDFITHTFGLPLQEAALPKTERKPKSDPLASVSLAEEQLTASRHQSHKHAESSHVDSPHDESSHAESSRAESFHVSEDESAALLARLHFSKSFLQALELLQQWNADSLTAARKHILRAQTELTTVVQTAHMGDSNPVGFQPQVNRRLLGPLPPRPVQELSQQKAWEYYSKLLKDLLTLCQLTTIQQWPQLQEFLLSFAKHSPSAVARSAMHAAITGKGSSHKGGGVPCWAPQDAMMCNHLCLPAPSQLPGPEAKLFVEQACIAVQGWCHSMCLNRSRQRRRHRRSMEDWANLFEHALNADASEPFQDWLHHRSSWRWQGPADQVDHPEEALGPCASWVEKSCSAVLLQHFMLGFELSLYQPKEFCMLYWYCDYLHGTVAMSAPLFLNVQPQTGSPTPPGKSKLPSLPAKSGKQAGKKSSTKGRSTASAKSHASTLAPDSPHFKYTIQEIHQAQVGRQMCQALMRVATGLMACGAIPNPEMPFNSELTRFEQRFSAFGFMQRPLPLVYEQYTAAMDLSGVEPSDLLKSAMQNFVEVRQALATLAQSITQSQLLTEDKLQDLKAIERVAVQNSVAIRILLKSMVQDSSLQGINVSWDFSHHACYPVIAVKHAASPASL